MNSENEMFEGPIVRTLLKISFPIFLGMLFDLLFNITDTFFLALIDKSDTTIVSGVGLIFPIAFLVIAITQGFYFGISTIVAIAVGRENLSRIKRTASTGMHMAGLTGLLVIIFTMIFGRDIVLFIAGNEMTPLAIGHATDYLIAVIPGAFSLITSHVLLGVLQGEGKTKHIGYTMLISTTINFILDPVLIFGFNMGAQGAGIATSIAQTVMLIYVVGVFIYQKGELFYSFNPRDISIGDFREILKFGVPQSLGMLSLGLSMIFINYIVSSIGENEMNAFTIVSRLDSMIIIPTTAISFGLSSMIGQNYGRRLISRVKKIYNDGMLFALITAASVALVYVFFSQEIISLFTEVEIVSEIAVSQILYLAHSLAMGVALGRCTASAFQALEKPIMSLFITLIRTFGVAMPVFVILLLNSSVKIEDVWISMALGNVLSGIISVVIFRRFTYKSVLKFGV